MSGIEPRPFETLHVFDEIHVQGEAELRAAARPRRIQRSRARGWRMPEGAIYVGRPSRWGNPFNVTATNSAEYAVERYRFQVERGLHSWTPTYREAFLALLRGRDLVCWCPLDQPCHADVLLDLANR